MPERPPKRETGKPNILERASAGFDRLVQMIGGIRGRTNKSAGAVMEARETDSSEQAAWRMVRGRGLETEEVLVHLGDTDGLRALAFEALLRSDTKRAEEILKNIGEPISLDFYRNLGNYYKEKRQYEAAMRVYKKLPQGLVRQALLKELLEAVKTDLMSSNEVSSYHYIECLREAAGREPTIDELLAFSDILQASGQKNNALHILHFMEHQTGDPRVFKRLGDIALRHHCQEPGSDSSSSLESAIRRYAKAKHLPGIIEAASLLAQISQINTVITLKDAGSIVTFDVYRAIAKNIPAENLKARTNFWLNVYRNSQACDQNIIMELTSVWLEKVKQERTADCCKYAEFLYCIADDKSGLRIIGDTWRVLGDFIGAARCYKKAKYEAPDADFYIKLGEQLVREEKSQEAKDAFRRALELGYKDGGGGGTPEGSGGGGSGGSGSESDIKSSAGQEAASELAPDVLARTAA